MACDIFHPYVTSRFQAHPGLFGYLSHRIRRSVKDFDNRGLLPLAVRYCCSGVGKYNTSAVEEKALTMKSIRCESERTRKDVQTRLGGQRWRCNACRRRFTARSTSAFLHHVFPDDIIALAIRWYVRYRLSYADVVEWLAERGLVVDRSTVYR
jgi:transposase-like protein